MKLLYKNVTKLTDVHVLACFFFSAGDLTVLNPTRHNVLEIAQVCADVDSNSM